MRCPFHGGDEAGGRQKLETFVDSSQKFGRNDQTLDRAELHALGLPLGRPNQLSG